MSSMSIEHHETPWHSSRRGKQVQAVVLHDTGPGTLNGVISWIQHPDSQVSYHYLIDREGRLHQFVDEERRAWHAGKSHFHGKKENVNSISIGVAFLNNGSEGYTLDQMRTGTTLIADLCRRHGISIHNVVGHRDVASPPGRKSDPHDGFDWDGLIFALAYELAPEPDA